MRVTFGIFFFALLLSSMVHAHENTEHKDSNLDLEKMAPPNDHHSLVHPFLTHMGIPDAPGEMNTRITSVEERTNGLTSGTYGFHLETGIVDRLGLHLRNDAVKFNRSSEMMLQYAVYKSDSGLSGISLLGEMEFPTGSTTTTTTGGAGISFAYILLPILAVNSAFHYLPRDKMTEWEISLVTKLTEKIFPIIEANGEKMKGGASIVNTLFGLKFKIPKGDALGIGYQVGTTHTRDFNSRLLLQADLSFQ